MTKINQSSLVGRGIISVSGSDARVFLQGLISNDMNKVSTDYSIYAAFLSPQGKYLYDFFIMQKEGSFLIDCELHRLKDLLNQLKLFKLRSDIDLSDCSHKFQITAIWGDLAVKKIKSKLTPGVTEHIKNDIVIIDPRTEHAGLRVISQFQTGDVENSNEVNFPHYDLHRISLGLTDGSRDLFINKTMLLEANFDKLNGVDWEKGCYLGQEVTARSKYRGLVKKRFVGVHVSNLEPQEGMIIMKDDTNVGEIRSTQGNYGIALLRVDSISDNNPLTLERNGVVTTRPQKWFKV